MERRGRVDTNRVFSDNALRVGFSPTSPLPQSHLSQPQEIGSPSILAATKVSQCISLSEHTARCVDRSQRERYTIAARG